MNGKAVATIVENGAAGGWGFEWVGGGVGVGVGWGGGGGSPESFELHGADGRARVPEEFGQCDQTDGPSTHRHKKTDHTDR